jgi:hypothetical protein
VVERLPSKDEALSSNSSTEKIKKEKQNHSGIVKEEICVTFTHLPLSTRAFIVELKARLFAYLGAAFRLLLFPLAYFIASQILVAGKLLHKVG